MAQLVPSPLHTPHSSTAPLAQHCPSASSRVAQQAPAVSTNLPLPPHMPHASTAPSVQHAPLASSVAPAGQQAPEASTMPDAQQASCLSTTPLVQLVGTCKLSRGRIGRFVTQAACCRTHPSVPPPAPIPVL